MAQKKKQPDPGAETRKAKEGGPHQPGEHSIAGTSGYGHGADEAHAGSKPGQSQGKGKQK